MGTGNACNRETNLQFMNPSVLLLVQVVDFGFSALEELNFSGEGAQQLQYLCISPAVAAFNTDKLATLVSLPNLYLRGSIAHLVSWRRV